MVNAIGIAQMEVLNGKESKWIVNEISTDINRLSININKISTSINNISIDYQYNISRLWHKYYLTD